MEELYRFALRVRGDVVEQYAKNDLAHQIDHPDNLVEFIMKYADKAMYHFYEQNNCEDRKRQFKRAAIVAAYYHDLFVSIDRDTHHVLAYEHVLRNRGKMEEYGVMKGDWYGFRDIAFACLEHRASWSGDKYYSPLSELVACADRGEPSDPELLFLRSYKYARSNKDKLGYKNQEECIKHAICHIHEKYGTNGYAKVPALYEVLFDNEMEHQRKRVDAIYTLYAERGEIPGVLVPFMSEEMQ